MQFNYLYANSCEEMNGKNKNIYILEIKFQLADRTYIYIYSNIYIHMIHICICIDFVAKNEMCLVFFRLREKICLRNFEFIYFFAFVLCQIYVNMCIYVDMLVYVYTFVCVRVYICICMRI